MTDFEDVARQKLSLAYSAPDRRRPPERNRFAEGITFFLGLIAGVVLIYTVLWPVVCVLFSIG